MLSCSSWKGLTLDLLTLGDPVDGHGVGDLNHGVEGGGDQPGEEGDYHREAEWIQIQVMQLSDFKVNLSTFNF